MSKQKSITTKNSLWQHAKQPGSTCYCNSRFQRQASAARHGHFSLLSLLLLCQQATCMHLSEHSIMPCSVSSMQQGLCGNRALVSLGCPAVINYNQTPDENSGVHCDVRSEAMGT